MELAVLDLGSTTFHLQHFQASAQAGLKSCLDLKICTTLGAQVFAAGYLDARSLATALEAVDELLEASNRRGFTQRSIVATSAMRTARNGRALARAIEARHDCQVTILAPSEEARLAYLGQLGFPGLAGKRFAMVDLGGGSVELSVGRDHELAYTESLPLGALRMCAQSAADGGTIEGLLRAPMRAISRLAPELIVFGSGSARAVRKLLWRQHALPGKVGPIVTEELRRELLALGGCSPEQLTALGVEPARATTVLTSAAIMIQILDMLGANEALVSDRGLRHGVASELWRKLERAQPRGRPGLTVSGLARRAAG